MLRLVVLALALPPLVLGATVLPLSRAELAARSDAVVRARVLAQACVRSQKSGRILTVSRLAVLESYKGAPPPVVELEQMGGTLDGMTLVVPGDARLAPDEEVVLFLRCAARERCHIFGLGLGKYGLLPGAGGKKIARRSLAGLVDGSGRALPDDQLPLGELERELRSRP
jgi:hypothetical protein